MPIKINGSTSGSTTITAPATGTDETIELSTALAAKAALASPALTGTPTVTASANDSIGPIIELRKNRAGAIVQNNDILGEVKFLGWNGSGYVQSAIIRSDVDGVPGASNDMPSRLSFFTTADGSGSVVERMRIDSNGNVGIGTNPVSGYRVIVTSLSCETSGASEVALQPKASSATYAQGMIYPVAVRAANSAYRFFAAHSNGGTDQEFNLQGDGNAFADGTWTGGGADYAEYFEWADGNPNDEDRRGISVTLDGNKIKPAGPTDTIIGVISGNPSVVGDAAWNKWSEKYLRDDFGTYVMEDYEVLQWTDADGKDRAVDADGPDAGDAPADATVVVQQRRKLNPAYDPEQEYVSREQRPEWDCVGLMGKLRVRVGQPTDPRWIKMRDVSETVEEWLVR